MCFNVDYDWYASISEVIEADSGIPCRCMECYKPIAKDQYRKHYFQQEHEYCTMHMDEDYENLNDDGLTCENDAENCAHGEEFEGDQCRDCCTILDAIKSVELAEGCRESNSQPPTGEMDEWLTNGEGWVYYADKMTALGLTEAAELVERIYITPRKLREPD